MKPNSKDKKKRKQNRYSEMSCFFSLQIPKALPSLSSSSVQCTTKTPFYISSKLNPTNPHKKLASITQKAVDYFDGKGSAFAIQAGALVLATPIILNWLRLRWYRRKLLEMYFQFMFVFLFYPGIMVWAPFLNFRKFPRDTSMKYPWSVPEDPSKVRNAYAKFPWADPEDYD
ncbi:hypothetical protein EZV62_018473 [Acer yangbiense]|uniref:NADH dehydrogenase-like complex L n=1 Tax=Acer yangbiense TaxID=1000413 RepID=A0A5C7HJG4_9ROSI|nr:hypothetical protein EZV62_018473 [Acer yangbiense]